MGATAVRFSKGSAVRSKEMLEKPSFVGAGIERICLLIAHHHTYDAEISGLDFRILLEADACVNMHESDAPEQARGDAEKTYFAPGSANLPIRQMFNIRDAE